MGARKKRLRKQARKAERRVLGDAIEQNGHHKTEESAKKAEKGKKKR